MRKPLKADIPFPSSRSIVAGAVSLASMVVLFTSEPSEAEAKSNAGQSAGSANGSLDCFREWSEALRWVKGERLADVSRVLQRVGDTTRGRVMSTRLCRPDAASGKPEFVYLVVVRGENGRLKQMVLDAKTLDSL